MTKALVDTASYRKLSQDVRALLEKGKEEAIASVNRIRVQTYWKVGKRIDAMKEAADPTVERQLISSLSDDLGLDTSLLYRILQLHRTWPDGLPQVKDSSPLSWAHFVELLSVKNEKARTFYLKSASLQDWSRDTLRKAIQKDFYTMEKSSKKKTTSLKRNTEPLHIYVAVVEKVVDGDTLAVRIDLGFKVWISQRVRFAGINTAELIKDGLKTGTAPDRAEQAKLFVEDKLKGIDYIVIKTYKSDMYGRYIADVFYHPTIRRRENIFSKGFWLNSQLVEVGLADLM